MSEREQVEQAIAALEAQRTILGDAVVDAALRLIHQQLAQLEPAAPEPAATLKGERKLVTIMFADIAGFTTLVERMDPETVRDLTNACFEQLVPVIVKYGGTVDKFLGDAIMALFGAPTTHENDPERALCAALEMMMALNAFNEAQGTDLGLHIGIDTGLVIAGSMGTRGRQEYSVVGDAANTASWLEEISERGEILVGPDTYRLTAPLFEFEALEPIRVKGKPELVPIYRLLAPKAVPGKVRGIVGLESPLVGRESEVRVLQEAIACLSTGAGGIVTIVGEAGLGKSRLVAEVRKAGPAGRLNWLEGRCLSRGSSIAYLLWLDVLRGLLGVTPELAPALVRSRLEQRLRELCPERWAQVYPYLGRLMTLPLEATAEASLRNLEGEALQAGIFGAMETLLQSIVRQQPTILVCEDLHWADPTSLELLERLLPLTERAALLFICVFRPERARSETETRCWRIREVAATRYHDHHSDLWLSPLSAVESATLVGNLLHVEDLPQELRRRILSHAEGNPFYLEEVIRSLIDDGAIVRDESSGHWLATRNVAEIAIPDTLHGVLMARIDRLQEETKRILQLAAVIGRIFLYRVLKAISQEERDLEGEIIGEPAAPTLQSHLRILQREEMIRERAQVPELEYIFKHQLTQEAAYNGLLKKDRCVFHRRVAEALERLFPDRIDEQVGLLAHHWERAEEAEKAADYLLRAGDQSRLVYAHQEAVDYYRRALALLKEQRDFERAARTQMKLGLTYHLAFDFRQARQAYEEGFALWQQAGERSGTLTLAPAPHALRVAWIDPASLDPTVSWDLFTVSLTNQLFSGLVRASPDMAIVPDVAKSWDVRENGLVYVFYLRDDVLWSDGTPVTAQDFVCSWRRTLDPATASPLAIFLYDIKGAQAFHQGQVSAPDHIRVRAQDEFTLVVELSRPTSHFLYLLAYRLPPPVPHHTIEKYGETWKDPENVVTNGPFRLESWQRGERMVLVRNPTYHGQFGGNVERVELCLRGQWLVTFEMYQAGDVDILRIPSPRTDRARRHHAGEYLSIPSLSTLYVAFNVSRPPFDDPRVRRAFVLATDRESLTNAVTGGHSFPAGGGFIPQGMPGHSPGIALPYDPAAARQLLAEAGYPNGRGFPAVTAITPEPRVPQGTHLKGQWQETLGVQVSWQGIDFDQIAEEWEKGTAHMLLMQWLADYPDPSNFLQTGPIRRETRWQNQAYERLVEEARSGMDQAKRIDLYQQADRILVEDAPIIALIYGRSYLLVKPWVSKYPTSAIKWWYWKDVIIEPH